MVWRQSMKPCLHRSWLRTARLPTGACLIKCDECKIFENNLRNQAWIFSNAEAQERYKNWRRGFVHAIFNPWLHRLRWQGHRNLFSTPSSYCLEPLAWKVSGEAKSIQNSKRLRSLKMKIGFPHKFGQKKISKNKSVGLAFAIKQPRIPSRDPARPANICLNLSSKTACHERANICKTASWKTQGAFGGNSIPRGVHALINDGIDRGDDGNLKYTHACACTWNWHWPRKNMKHR